jgi:Uma2 family endonuclease
MELNLDLKKRYTYADYLTWIDDKKRELIDGFISLMSPAPASIHANLSGNIYFKLRNYIEKKRGKCKIFSAPFDVRLPKNEENKSEKSQNEKIYSVVQPDICIICDLEKIDARGCLGAPDFIAEILSPSTAKKDYNEKFYLYEKSGVREYWIVDAAAKFIQTFILQENGKYDEGKVYDTICFDEKKPEERKVPVNILDGFELDLEEIFEI